ncbi:MAG: hypothetical protein ABJO86_00860 [Lentilitoribacter sp.]
MRIKIVFSSLMVALLFSGCAKRPNAVVPANLPSQTYANYNCKQLNELLLKEQANEKALSSKQRGAADADAIGVFLVGLPISGALGGDVEGELSVAKGKVLSIQSQRIAKQCGI